jgi:16S rRNA (guanine966-N2)-methyltransferase
MRIIAGKRRGAALTRLDAANTRPTADRVRESLFNILEGGHFGACLDGAMVIDLFAGSGSLGLEALSRGSAHAIFVETQPSALATIRANIAKLRFQDQSSVIAGDATRLTHWRAQPAGLVFADAPYSTGAGLIAVANCTKIGAIAPRGIVVIETGKAETLDQDLLDSTGLTPLERRGYGRAMLHFLVFAG